MAALLAVGLAAGPAHAALVTVSFDLGAGSGTVVFNDPDPTDRYFYWDDVVSATFSYGGSSWDEGDATIKHSGWSVWLYDSGLDGADLWWDDYANGSNDSGIIYFTNAAGAMLSFDEGDQGGRGFSFTDPNDHTTSGTYSASVVTGSVPEPATVLLLGAGLAGLGMARRRRVA